MGKLESLVVGTFVAILVPVCLFFAAWWLSVGIAPERYIFACALGGLVLGAVLDVLFVRRWTSRAYRAPLLALMLLSIFGSVVTYAVFMGVPVGILVPGAVAGAYIGRRLVFAGAAGDAAARTIRRTGFFAAGVIACAAAFSAYLVLRYPFAAADLERMFRLKFMVTRPMIIALVAIGGPALVACQYWLTTRAARIAYGAQGKVETDAR